jgi:endogenous inhibitor of DNA gyrase (YacG/DUF329 family)
MNKITMVKCPQCDKKFNYFSSEFRPFCCERCKQIDLGMWFNEAYTVASNEPLSDNDLERVLEEHQDDNENY